MGPLLPELVTPVHYPSISPMAWATEAALIWIFVSGAARSNRLRVRSGGRRGVTDAVAIS